MKMCPECSLELPDGIPQCPDCEIPMIDPDELYDDAEPFPLEQRYVLLRTYPTRLYATMLKEALQNEGIPSILQSEDVGVMLGNYYRLAGDTDLGLGYLATGEQPQRLAGPIACP